MPSSFIIFDEKTNTINFTKKFLAVYVGWFCFFFFLLVSIASYLVWSDQDMPAFVPFVFLLFSFVSLIILTNFYHKKTAINFLEKSFVIKKTAGYKVVEQEEISYDDYKTTEFVDFTVRGITYYELKFVLRDKEKRFTADRRFTLEEAQYLKSLIEKFVLKK